MRGKNSAKRKAYKAKPKGFAALRSAAVAEPPVEVVEEIVKEKTGQEVKMKGESDKKEDKVKQKNDVKEKQETLKKETKEKQVVMKEEIQPQDEPKPKLVIESPSASVEGTLTVKMDEKAGVGDGKLSLIHIS